MAKKNYTINNAGGGSDSSDLIGCHIKQTDDGYDFTEPNGTVLASTTSTTPRFTFPAFAYEGWTWTITVSSIASAGVTGGWSNNNPSIEGEEGTYSTGTGADEESDESASSAYA
jgi:hypothetical protein